MGRVTVRRCSRRARQDAAGPVRDTGAVVFDLQAEVIIDCDVQRNPAA